MLSVEDWAEIRRLHRAEGKPAAAIARPKRLGGGPAGLVVGIAGSLYGGLGVAQAFQYAANTAWGVPRNNRPNPFKARGRSVLLLATAGLAVLGTTALSIGGGGGGEALGTAGRFLALAASVAINIAVAIFAFRFAPARRLSVRDVVPGATAAAVIWQLLQSFGVIYVRHVVEHASATNAVFALVLGLLAFLYITATAVLPRMEINVVHVNRLHPRSLLTLFTDNVTLTTGDRRAYSRQARAQRSKGFQHVKVNFDPPSPEPGHDDPGPPASARIPSGNPPPQRPGLRSHQHSKFVFNHPERRDRAGPRAPGRAHAGPVRSGAHLLA